MIYRVIGQIVKLNPLAFLIASISAIGWGVSAKGTKDGNVEGMVIGTHKYIDGILKRKK